MYQPLTKFKFKVIFRIFSKIIFNYFFSIDILGLCLAIVIAQPARKALQTYKHQASSCIINFPNRSLVAKYLIYKFYSLRPRIYRVLELNMVIKKVGRIK